MFLWLLFNVMFSRFIRVVHLFSMHNSIPLHKCVNENWCYLQFKSVINNAAVNMLVLESSYLKECTLRGNVLREIEYIHIHTHTHTHTHAHTYIQVCRVTLQFSEVLM